jgi:hypothetical protein
MADRDTESPLLGAQVRAWGFEGEFADLYEEEDLDPADPYGGARGEPVSGELYAVRNPHTKRLHYYVEDFEVDPATAVPISPK